MSTPTSCCNCSGERVYQWGQNEVSHVKVGLLNRIWQDWFGLTVHKGCINMPISNLHRIVMTSVNEVTAVWHTYLQGAYYPPPGSRGTSGDGDALRHKTWRQWRC